MDHAGIFLNLLFPSRCPVCNSPSDSHAHNPFCSACWSSIERYTGASCGICGIPAPSHLTGICAECIREKPPFTKILFYGIYKDALKESIRLLKFQGVKRLAKPLGSLLLRLPLGDYDAVVPVPLHRKKLKEREFNQTALLARHLAASLKIPLLLDSLSKIRETKLQTEVGREGRLANLKKAFAASQGISGMRLLLVDDVITTGATVSECSSALTKAGAAAVEVIALARSMPKY